VANGFLALSQAQGNGAGTDNFRCITQPAPATPWEVTAKVSYDTIPAVGGYPYGGLVLMDGAGRITTHCLRFENLATWTPHLAGYNYTNFSTYAGTASYTVNSNVPALAWFYLRAKDDGANLTFSWSLDGVTFQLLGTYGRTTFFTVTGPTLVGLAIDAAVASGTSVSLACDWFRRTDGGYAPSSLYGATGYTGYTGYTGPGNFTGYTGYTGYSGPAGSASSTGATGYTGPSAGPQGDTGYTGYSGYTGYTGYTGYSGYTGYTGPASSTSAVPVLVWSAAGPVGDPGGNDYYLFNNYGALTFNAPGGSTVGMQRIYTNAAGITGAMTIQLYSGNRAALYGVNGAASGTLASGGAAGDAIGLVCDAANHWTAYPLSGTWTKT